MGSAKGAERLSGLALSHTYRDWKINTDKVIQEFCAKKVHQLVKFRILNIYMVQLKCNVGIDLHVITIILFKRLKFSIS